MQDIKLDRLLTIMNRNQYPVFEQRDYNLNLIGVRSKDRSANTFNDTLFVLYWIDRLPVLHRFPMTTDPGTYYREHPVNVDGTAVLAAGHYSKCWQIGMHRGQYKALVQHGIMAVYRDKDLDSEIDIDPKTIQTGYFGINLHHSGRQGPRGQVDKTSAGCQVLQIGEDFDLVMALAEKAADDFGPSFSYTLLDENEC